MVKRATPDKKLLDACDTGDVKAARAALASGASVAALDRDRCTPLHGAVFSNAKAVVALLIKHGADVNAQDRRGFTPLHAAAVSCLSAVARVLLEHGADVDALDEHGNTPLGKTVFYCRDGGRMVKLLLDHGANPKKKNKHGVSAIALARNIDGYDIAWFGKHAKK